MNTTNTTYAVLTRDWTYTNMVGEKVTFKKGRRFRLDETTYFDRTGDLVLCSWYGYGLSEVIEKKYFEKKV